MIDIGSGFDNEQLNNFVAEQDYPGVVSIANREMLKLLDVRIQSTKIAIDSEGMIVYREGYGKGSKEKFISVFKRISS